MNLPPPQVIDDLSQALNNTADALSANQGWQLDQAITELQLTTVGNRYTTSKILEEPSTEISMSCFANVFALAKSKLKFTNGPVPFNLVANGVKLLTVGDDANFNSKAFRYMDFIFNMGFVSTGFGLSVTSNYSSSHSNRLTGGNVSNLARFGSTLDTSSFPAGIGQLSLQCVPYLEKTIPVAAEDKYYGKWPEYRSVTDVPVSSGTVTNVELSDADPTHNIIPGSVQVDTLYDQPVDLVDDSNGYLVDRTTGERYKQGESGYLHVDYTGSPHFYFENGGLGYGCLGSYQITVENKLHIHYYTNSAYAPYSFNRNIGGLSSAPLIIKFSDYISYAASNEQGCGQIAIVLSGYQANDQTKVKSQVPIILIDNILKAVYLAEAKDNSFSGLENIYKIMDLPWSITVNDNVELELKLSDTYSALTFRDIDVAMRFYTDNFTQYATESTGKIPGNLFNQFTYAPCADAMYVSIGGTNHTAENAWAISINSIQNGKHSEFAEGSSLIVAHAGY